MSEPAIWPFCSRCDNARPGTSDIRLRVMAWLLQGRQLSVPWNAAVQQLNYLGSAEQCTNAATSGENAEWLTIDCPPAIAVIWCRRVPRERVAAMTWTRSCHMLDNGPSFWWRSWALLTWWYIDATADCSSCCQFTWRLGIQYSKTSWSSVCMDGTRQARRIP